MSVVSAFFFFNDTATTEIYTLSLHDALPISPRAGPRRRARPLLAPPDLPRPTRLQGPQTRLPELRPERRLPVRVPDRKSTRLNSSHANISYAVFCLKKKTRPPLT